MQIHELNNYTGDLDSGAYLAVDNGSDTGKVSAEKIVRGVSDDVSALETTLNARIDNIIAGGTAPSAAEVTDARQGENGITYTSLGSAIRGQFEDVYNTLEMLADDGNYQIANAVNPLNWVNGDIVASTGADANAGSIARLVAAQAFYSEDGLILKSLADVAYYYVYKYNDQALTDFVGELPQILNYQGVTEIELEAGYWYRIKGTFKTTRNPISDSDRLELVSGITVYKKTIITELSDTVDDFDSRITENTNEIEGIHDNFYIQYGRNRFDGITTPGYFESDGHLVVYGNWVATDYIDVHDLDEVCASYDTLEGTTRLRQNFYFLCTYDEDKNFIERVYDIAPYTWTVAEGVYYIRFCYDSSVCENIMLESGSNISSTYYPYTAQNKLDPECYQSGTDWSAKKWAAVGDSLTERNLRSNMNYHDYVAEITGINVYNMGSSGTGYKRTEDENKAFYQRILNVPSDTDVVTIFGSGNDLNYAAMGFNSFAEALGDPTDSGTSTICGCINKTIENLYSVLPTVQLGIVTPCPWQGNNPSDTTNPMALYSAAIVEICRLHGIPCLDLYHCSGMRPWDATFRSLCYSKDEGNGTHPDETGHKILAPHFKDFLNQLVL